MERATFPWRLKDELADASGARIGPGKIKPEAKRPSPPLPLTRLDSWLNLAAIARMSSFRWVTRLIVTPHKHEIITETVVHANSPLSPLASASYVGPKWPGVP